MLKNTLRQRLGIFFRPASGTRGKLSLIDFFIINPIAGLLFDLSGGTYKTEGCHFVFTRKMTTLGWRGAYFWRDQYETDERRLIKQFVVPEDSVIEIGACLGVVSCVTNRLLKNPSKHLVVEANPYLIPWLTQNQSLNASGFMVEHCAIGNPPETTFYVHSTGVMDGSCQNKSAHPIRLPARPLKELHERHGPFSCLIMDAEGAEYDVLEQAEELMKSYRLAVIEFHPWIIGEDKTQRCRQILKNAGLRQLGASGTTEAWCRE
jgi:FkbM family methyltransferase